MRDTALHVVFGAGGGAGSAVVRALAEQGRRTRAITHSAPPSLPGGVEHVRADALDAKAVATAARDAAVIYHCVNTPYETWPDTLPGILDNIIAAAAASDATLVYCDNLYMYGAPAGPLTEDTPQRPAGPKGRLRADLAERLFDAHSRGTVRAVSGRASDFFGPGASNTIAGQLVFPAARAGRRAYWLGSLDEPHSLNFVDDVGRQLVTLGTDERSPGAVWHLPAPPAITGRAFIEKVFEHVGKQPKMGRLPHGLMRLAGLFSRRMREIAGVVYQFEQPFVIDGARFVETFGEAECTSIDRGIELTLAAGR